MEEVIRVPDSPEPTSSEEDALAAAFGWNSAFMAYLDQCRAQGGKKSRLDLSA
jgi:hypothetical protein